MVQLDKVESFTHSGIYVPPQLTERNQMNQTEGTVAVLGPLAYKDMRAWDGDKQEWIQLDWIRPGDRVKFQLHHGWVHLETVGDEKYEYRVLHDTDITMVLRGKEENHE
jgi:co-chaperonin GroES (HSP10)